nr:unnamed protein product [Callosobruchus chinensis]
MRHRLDMPLVHHFSPEKDDLSIKNAYRSAVAAERTVVFIPPINNNYVLTATNFFYENPGRFSCSACDWLQLLNHEEECGRHSQGSAGRQLKLQNTSSSIVLPCAEEESRIWKLSRRREDRQSDTLIPNNKK